MFHPNFAPSDALTGELQELVRSGIGRHAYPRTVDYVAELPKTATGKLRRAELRRDAAAAGTIAPSA